MLKVWIDGFGWCWVDDKERPGDIVDDGQDYNEYDDKMDFEEMMKYYPD